MSNIEITDLSLMELPNAPSKLIAAFCRLIIGTGVTSVEMTPTLFKRLEDDALIANVSLKILNFDEYLFFKKRGITIFSVEARDFAKFPQNTKYKHMTVILPTIKKENVSWLTQYYKTEKAVEVEYRICGLENVISGDYQDVFKKIIFDFDGNVCFDASDAKYTGTAAALEWAFLGGGAVCSSFAGLGGHAATEQLLASLNIAMSGKYDLTSLPELRTAYEYLTGIYVSYHSPVMGSEIFTYESGIHADGIKKNPVTYEPFEPHSVGANRRLVVGKHSGRAAIRAKLLEIGAFPDDSLLLTINETVRYESVKKGRGLHDDELLEIYHNNSN